MASSKTLQQILGYVPLLGLITRIRTGIPELLPPAFKSITKRIAGNAGRYTRRVGVRTLATRVEYGAPSVNRALRPIESIDVILRASSENIVIPPMMLQTLRGYTTYEMQDLAVEELANQIADFEQVFANLELAEKYSMLANGALWWDAKGNLLPSSSGATTTASYGISANNQSHLNGIITQSWANFNTNIPLQIRNLKVRAAQLTGFPLKYAFYSVTIPDYLIQNAYVLDFLSREPDMRKTWLDTGEVPSGLMGLTWVPVYTAFYQDANGVNQTFFPADTVTFTPDITREAYEVLEGSTMIPTQFNVFANAMAALNSAKMVYGNFGYALPSVDPLTFKVILGDCRFPAWKIPDTIYQANVVV
jgi:hypothetical protein